MTFEAGRKKQLLVLQPKGKPLYDGDSKSFGLKMLENMGWKKGNGLGRAQQGSLDFIQVRYKNNSNGLGFDGLKDNQWTENETSFDNLLKNLNSQSNSNSSDETEQRTKAKSLEEMSKTSRARVHYKKYTKGKDVYKYSEKDLANILGKKSLKEDKTKEAEAEIPEETEIPDTYKSDSIVNTGVSITDYFQQKRMQKTQKSMNSSLETESHEHEVPSKKRKKRDKTEIQPLEETKQDDNEISDKTSEIKKKKKKRKTESIEEEPVEQEIPNKKSKKKSKKEEPVAEDTEKVTKKKKRKMDKDSEKQVVDVSKPESSNVQSQTNSNDVDRPRGANAVYSTDVVLIPSHVAQKMTDVLINNFNNANLGNIIGYGMTDDIEIKVVETKMGAQFGNDKYALYNMDKLTKPRVNSRKILTKIKKTKKSIQVI